MWRWIFFVFFLSTNIFKDISSYYCKLALKSVLIRGFQKLFAFKACLHIYIYMCEGSFCRDEFERILFAFEA